MLRNYLACGSAALVLAAAGGAMAQNASNDPPAPTGTGQLTTPGFIQAAAQSDNFEIRTGELAASKGSSADVRNFGQMMVADHGMTTKSLTAAASKAGISTPPPPPPPLRSDQQKMLEQLQGLSGAAFDRTYLTQQLQAHREALQLHSDYAARGTDGGLKTVASTAVPIVQHHLDMLTKMQGATGGGR